MSPQPSSRAFQFLRCALVCQLSVTALPPHMVSLMPAFPKHELVRKSCLRPRQLEQNVFRSPTPDESEWPAHRLARHSRADAAVRSRSEHRLGEAIEPSRHRRPHLPTGSRAELINVHQVGNGSDAVIRRCRLDVRFAPKADTVGRIYEYTP